MLLQPETYSQAFDDAVAEVRCFSPTITKPQPPSCNRPCHNHPRCNSASHVQCFRPPVFLQIVHAASDDHARKALNDNVGKIIDQRFVSAHVCLSAYLHMCMHTHTCLCAHICVCAHTYAHVWLSPIAALRTAVTRSYIARFPLSLSLHFGVLRVSSLSLCSEEIAAATDKGRHSSAVTATMRSLRDALVRCLLLLFKLLLLLLPIRVPPLSFDFSFDTPTNARTRTHIHFCPFLCWFHFSKPPGEIQRRTCRVRSNAHTSVVCVCVVWKGGVYE